jgi:hypothetical protein
MEHRTGPALGQYLERISRQRRHDTHGASRFGLQGFGFRRDQYQRGDRIVRSADVAAWLEARSAFFTSPLPAEDSIQPVYRA